MAWKPITLARDLCCNFTDGRCTGTGYKRMLEHNGRREYKHFEMMQDGQLLEARPCRLGKGLRCTFFERYVIPAVNNNRIEGLILRRRLAAKAAYISRFPLEGHTGDRRFCGCGEPLARRRRFCDKCRKRRRKDTKRSSRATSPMSTGQLTENAISEVSE